jgi:hypothetical protein
MSSRIFGVILIALFASTASAQSGMTQQQMDEMNKRGDKHMGFDHMKTTHHFLLAKDGGAIQVEANDLKDTESRDQIRSHLRHIAMMFSGGNFNTPMLIHEKTPPGSEVMSKLKSEIRYEFKETETGAKIIISSENQEAIRAVHEFLKFQIKEHKTGDPLEIVLRSQPQMLAQVKRNRND